MFISKNKRALMFLILFIHVYVLNLFYMAPEGPVFYWKENLNIEAFVVYFVIAFLSVIFYMLITKGRQVHDERVIKVSDSFWLGSSIFTILLIAYLMI